MSYFKIIAEHDKGPKGLIADDVQYINVHTHPLDICNYSPFDKVVQLLNNRLGWSLIHFFDSLTKKTREARYVLSFIAENPQILLTAEDLAFDNAVRHLFQEGHNLPGKMLNVGMTMNFDHAGFGPDFSPEYQYGKQYEAALDLAKNNRGYFIPALSIDPRDEHMMERAERHLALGFRVFKIYPSLGFTVYDKKLMDKFYPWVIEHGGSIITHSGTGGFGTIQKRIEVYDEQGERQMMQFKSFWHPKRPELKPWFNHPKNWRKVYAVYPQLRVNQAHFGGPGDIADFVHKRAKLDNCTEEIVWQCENPKYSNKYSDISYTLYDLETNKRIREHIFKDHPIMRERLMFGTDHNLVLMDRKIDNVFLSFFRYWKTYGEEYIHNLTFRNAYEFLNFLNLQGHPFGV